MAHSDSSGCSFTSENRAIKGQTGVVVAFDIFFDPQNWHWSKGGKIGGVLTLDLIPVELAQRQGVIFLVPVDAPVDGDDEGGSQ